MLIRKILLVSIILCLSTTIFAQKIRYSVFLKNGNIVKGEIIEQEAEDIVIVKTAEGKIDSLKVDEILEIKYIGSGDDKDVSIKFKKEGYIFISEVGLLFMGAKSIPFTLHFSNSYMVESNVGLGFGTGIEFLNSMVITAPAFVDVRYYFSGRERTPFLFCRPGYSILLYSDYYEGYQWGGFINIGVGIKTTESKNRTSAWSFGFRHHQMHFSDDDPYYGKLERSFYHYGFFVNHSLLFR